MARKNVLIAPDMTDVDDEGGGGGRIPAGDYLMECADARADQSKAGGDMFVWKFRGLEGPAKARIFYLYTSLSPTALWKLKQTTKALGIYDDGGFEIDIDAVRGTQVVGVVLDNEYTNTQGQTVVNSKLDTVRAVDAEATATAKPVAASTARAAVPPPRGNGKRGKELPQMDAAEVRKMTADELEDLVETYKLGLNLAKSPTLKSKVAATIQGLDNAGMLSE
jgi:hypothetical protein